MYQKTEFEAESVQDEGGISIRFGNDWYRSIDDFFAKAVIDGERIPARCARLYAFKVV